MSTIAAGTSSGTALVSTGNTDGTIQLQVNGTTPSVTLAANGSIGVGSSPSYGLATQVLTSAGTGSAPTWTTPSAGALTFLSTVTASASATVDIETTFNSTYDEYLIVVDNLVPSVDAIELYCRLKVGGTYATTNYVFHAGRPSSVSTSYAADSAAIASPATQITILGNSNLSSDATATAHVEIRVSNPASTTKVKTIHWKGVCMNTINELQSIVGAGANTASTALTGVRLYASSGNLSCTARLYGIANS